MNYFLIPTSIHRLDIVFIIIMITNHPPQRNYNHQLQNILAVEGYLDQYLIIEIEIEIVIIAHLQHVHLNHQSLYHLLIITFLLLKNNNRIQTVFHVHHGRTHILVQNLMNPGSTTVLDRHLVIIRTSYHHHSYSRTRSSSQPRSLSHSIVALPFSPHSSSPKQNTNNIKD